MKLSDLTPEQRLDLGDKLRSMDDVQKRQFMESLTVEQQKELLYDSIIHLRRKQFIPVNTEKNIHLINAGRGFGKTFCISRMYKYYVEELNVKYLTLAAPTNNDLVNTLINGASGLMNAYEDDHPNRPVYMPHYGVIKHANGAVTRLVSSESPSRSRGINSEVLLADEVSSWTGADKGLEMFHNLIYGLRLGISQAILVTTPQATPLMIELFERAKDPNDVVNLIIGSTFENEANLSKAMIDNAKRTMNSRFGSQEVLGQMILTNDAAAWSPALLDKCRATTTGEFAPSKWTKLVVGIDPAGESTSKSSDKTGIIVAALTETNKVIVLEDASDRMTGETAVNRLCELYAKYNQVAPVKFRIEDNGLGHYFKAMVKQAAPHLPIESFSSVNKKLARAIATAFRYETEEVFHDSAANLKDLENEMVTFTGVGRSPDRLDALTFAVDGLFTTPSFVKKKRFII